MCGIIVAKKSKINDLLTNQSDRGLDSIGLIDIDNINYFIRQDLDEYKEYIDKLNISDDKFSILHHRKASVGAVNIDNAHPFIGTKFVLLQNGTSNLFHKTESDIYKKDVDSHNILKFLEDNCEELNEIPAVMDLFKEEYKDNYGILIVLDFNGNILFLSDGERESYIEAKDNKISYISNYEELDTEGYKNIGFIIFDFEGNIINSSIEVYNEKLFKPKLELKKNYGTSYFDRIYGGYTTEGDSVDEWYDRKIINTRSIKKSKKIKKSKQKNKNKDTLFYYNENNLIDLWLDENQVSLYIMEGEQNHFKILCNYLKDTHKVNNPIEYRDKFGGNGFPFEYFRNALEDLGIYK